MSRYNAIIENDIANGEGICVSFFVQGCPHKCPGCFNPETWDFTGGREYTSDIKWELIRFIGANGLQRNFSVLGGEPLAPENVLMTEEVINAVRTAYPHIKIFLWTGYTFHELKTFNNKYINLILDKIDYLIDGPYLDEYRDLNLKLRGSLNQQIWEKTEDGWRVRNG